MRTKYCFMIFTIALSLLNIKSYAKKIITFADKKWEVSTYNGTGQNYANYNDTTVQMINGELHLYIDHIDTFYCAEVRSTESYGYGEYIFNVKKIDNQINEINSNIVFGLFLYQKNYDEKTNTWLVPNDPFGNPYLNKENEIDIEFSRWNGEVGEINSQYTFQYRKVGEKASEIKPHRFNFDFSDNNIFFKTTHRIIWQPNFIRFESYYGEFDFINKFPTENDLIDSYEYRDERVPVDDDERVILNLWLYKFLNDDGSENPNFKFPSGTVEVIVSDFKYIKASTENPQFTRIITGDIVNDSIVTNGCTWVDYNNDGFLDLFVVGNDKNYLYKNNGDSTFLKITDSTFLKHEGIHCVGSAWADYDNDGNLDVYIATLKQNTNYFYKNNGDGTFTQITDGIIGTDIFQNVGGISWGDFNNDGIIDLFAGNYNYFHDSSRLYYADGTGDFYQIKNCGIVDGNTQVFGTVTADFDNDGDLDIFISNQIEKNRLYVNKGNGEFEEFTQDSILGEYDWTTGASWGDYDNDGDFDLFVCNGSGSYNANNYLYRNNGDGTITKVDEGIVVNDGGYSYVSSWIDYDNDGWLDLFVINRKATAPFLYHNNGYGTFTKITDELFLHNDSLDYDAACWGDYDNDGFLDLYISTWHAKNRLYRNLGNGNNWLELRLVGKESNRTGIGAKIRVKATINGKSFWQLRQIASQASFRSQNDLIAHFGLGDAQIIDSLKIEWPSGIVDIYTNVEPNRFVTATENQGLTPIKRQNDLKVPKEFIVYQNYPNPFNPNTHISFDLPTQSNVKIEIFNIQGQRVKTLLDRRMQAGNHVVNFNAANLSSGVYFYRVQAGKFQKVKKMILVK